jgi:hypothetical protein
MGNWRKGEKQRKFMGNWRKGKNLGTLIKRRRPFLRAFL